MPSAETLGFRNSIYITVTYFHLELMPKPASLKIAETKLRELKCIII